MSRIRLHVAMLNLAVTGLTFLFFLLAPVFGFPARSEDTIGLAMIAAPVFLGYLGFAGAFAARVTPDVSPEPEPDRIRLLSALAYGVTATYVVLAAAACIAFWVTNRRSDVLDGTGMSLDTLRTSLTLSLGIFTAVSNHIVTRLFPVERRR